MKTRIFFAIVVVALLSIGFLIPYSAAQEPAVDPVAEELAAAEALEQNPPVLAGESVPASPKAIDPDDVLYFWDFEANNGGFVGTLDWEWGTYAWTGATCDSSNYPPPAAYSGTNMWGTVLNSCYVNLGNNQGYSTCVNSVPADDSILSFTADLTGVTSTVELSWWEWYDLFSNWDWAEVYVNGNVVFQHCEPSFIQPTAWVQQVVDLTSYIGGVANVEFHMMASSVVNHAGWYLDDVMISTGAAAPDIEVTAPPLEAELCPDETTTLEFSICNVGDAPLAWTLSEVAGARTNWHIASSGPAAAQGNPAQEAERAVELVLESAPAEAGNTPAAPQPLDSVSLILDDGTNENNIGIGGTLEFIYLNRFTPNFVDYPFELNEIHVYFAGGTTYVNPGDDIALVVYENTSGNVDPAVGSNWLATFPTTVQAVNVWNVYDISATPVLLNGPGDVLIGVLALEVPGSSYFPAALDQTASQQRSWAGWWNASPPPTPPTLPPDASWTLIDAYFPGNWLVRGYGETLEDVPWLSEDPISGTVAAGECVTVEVTFDSTGAPPGDYFADLIIASNDPDEPEITLPVTMTVLPCVEPHIDLLPDEVDVIGCSGVDQIHTFSLENWVPGLDTFDLTYEVLSDNGSLTGPTSVVAAYGLAESFDVTLTPDECLFPGDQVIVTIHAEDATGVYSDTSILTKTITAGMDEWLSAADTPQGVGYHAVAYYDGAVFRFGGAEVRWTPLDLVLRYDIATDTWTTAAPMLTGTFAVDAVTIGDLIYLPGGSPASGAVDWLSGGTFHNTLQIYDPVADSWSSGAVMPAPLAAASAVGYDGLLYVIGGMQNSGIATNTLYIYDPVANSWTTGTPMNEGRAIAAAGAVDGKIYIAGGFTGNNAGSLSLDSMEIYDIAAGTWSYGPSLPEVSAPYGDGEFQDRYFIVYNGGAVTSNSYYCGYSAIWFDTVTGVWENLPGLPRCLYASQGVATDDRFYIVNGRTNEGGWHMAVEVEYLQQCPPCTAIGVLQGTMMDAETGDVDPVCSGGYVHLDPGDIVIPVMPDGTFWAEVVSRTYDYSASAPGYSTETGVVSVETGMTTTLDVSLQRPVIDVDPTAFDVQVEVGEPQTLPLTIDNLGHLPLDFEILDLPPGVFLPLDGGPTFQTTWLEGDVEVDPQVYAELETKGKTEFFVQLRLQADLSPAYDIRDWTERGQYVYDALRAATTAQAPIVAYAQGRGLAYETRLSNNSVFIKGGTLADVDALAARADVYRIRANHVYQIEDVEQSPAPEVWGWNLDELDPNAGLYGMQAVQVWQDYGISGQGIVVGNLDTGVFYRHEALVQQYRGNNGDGTFDHDYNWYAPTVTATNACPGAATVPCDYSDHGSGTMGIMVGETQGMAEQIGIAPGAQWIACMGCDSPPNGCSEEALTKCADWMIAPCPIGADPGDPACDPNQRPHVINNSWGGPGCDLWYQGYIQAWRAAGQFPAFSAGNTVGCGAVGSPGDTPEAFGTAAHAADGENLYAGGPSCHFPEPSCDPDAHEVDPHLNAPSFGRTAGNTQGEYWDLSGTSGASPHTAGCVALMWAANPALIGDMDTTFTILEQSADRTSTQAWAGGDCGKPACAGTDTYPNYEYGWGYLDCRAAVEWAISLRPDLPWVGVDPALGTVPSLDTLTIDVAFTCVQTGTYTGTLYLMHNDPCADSFQIPLTLECIEPVEDRYYIYLPVIVKND